MLQALALHNDGDDKDDEYDDDDDARDSIMLKANLN